MIYSDLTQLVVWWLALLAIGLIFYPLTSKLFSNFWDKGYIFSKVLGLALSGYLIWLLASLKLAAFSQSLIILVIGWFLLANLYLLWQPKTLRKLGKNSLSAFLIEEVIFSVGLIFWAYVKSFEPSIHGLEKFMDYGFINSILRSDYFPPKDLWLSPFTINYYYFGHFIAAMIIKITQVNPDVGFNLMLASLFGVTLTGSFSLGSNLYYLYLNASKSKALPLKPVITSGILSSFLVTLGGNLQTIYAFFTNYQPADKPIPFWQLKPMLNLQGYWYPNATRFIPFTIHEFPIYSFVVSDLHGHVLNIPFILLALALEIQIYLSPQDFDLTSLASYALLSLTIAISLMSNFLDGPIYLLLTFLIFFGKKIRQKATQPFLTSLKLSLAIFGLAIFFSLPYWFSFRPFGSGLGILCAPNFLTNIGKLGVFLFEPDHCMRSPIWMLALLWGFFYFVILSFLISFSKLKVRYFLFKLSSALLPIKLRGLKPTLPSSPALRERGFSKAAITTVRSKIKRFFELSNIDSLVLLLALFATILLIIPELVYVKDIYPAHYRANTVFKFGYQAFISFGLICGYMLVRMVNLKRIFLPILLIALMLFLLVGIYPLFAVNSYFGGLQKYKGLNGFSYFSDLYLSDYRAIIWLRKNVSGQPVILEAQGDSYTDFARVSSNTGLPTVIGWPVHEWLWRGSYDEAGKRSNEVSAVYQSQNLDLTKKFLTQYNVSYVFIGSLERQKYPRLNEAQFKSLGRVVFQDGLTVVYKVTR